MLPVVLLKIWDVTSLFGVLQAQKKPQTLMVSDFLGCFGSFQNWVLVEAGGVERIF